MLNKKKQTHTTFLATYNLCRFEGMWMQNWLSRYYELQLYNRIYDRISPIVCGHARIWVILAFVWCCSCVDSYDLCEITTGGDENNNNNKTGLSAA